MSFSHETIKSISMHVRYNLFIILVSLVFPPCIHGHFFYIRGLLLACFISKPKNMISDFDIMLVILKKTSVISYFLSNLKKLHLL